MTNTGTGDEPQKLLKIQEVADLFQISRSTAFRLRKVQGWPCIRFGTEIRFSAENIRAIQEINAESVPPAKQPRSTRTGTELSRRRAHAYNVRNGLTERPLP